jgi:hypothetical protein
MKTQEQIEKEIEVIKRNQEELRRQNRKQEADYWNDIIYHLKWVIE